MSSAATATPDVSQGSSFESPVESSFTPPSAGELRLDDIREASRNPERTTTQTQEQSVSTGETGSDEASQQDGAAVDTAESQTGDGDLIERVAQLLGLDPETDRTAIEKLAKTPQIQALLNPDSQNAQAAEPVSPDAELTEFEKELAKAAQEQKTAEAKTEQKQPEQNAAPQQPPMPKIYGDVGDAWKDPKDSYAAENEAWQNDDLDKVHDINKARFVRFSDSMLVPYMHQQIERAVQQALGSIADVVPAVRQQAARSQYEQNRTAAIADLAKTPGFDFAPKMFEPEDGPPLKYDGREYPNTPFNRIVAKYPEINKIQVQHDNPAIGQRLTLIERYRAAGRIYRDQQNKGIPPAKVQEVFKAGAQTQQKANNDRARQALNSGKGSTGLGTAQPEESYVERLLRSNSSAGERSVSDLLSR